MARHVRDLRLALNAMSGPDARDPRWTPAPLLGPPVEKPIKVAICVNPGSSGVDQDVKEGVEKAAAFLSTAGYIVEEVEPPALARAAELWEKLVATDIRTAFLSGIKQTACADAITFLDHFLGCVPELTLDSYVEALAERNGIARAWNQFAQDYPLILGPVSTMQPFPLGYDLAGQTEVRELLHAMRLVVSINLLGLPSVAVPVGVANGIPQGVQIVGARYREDLCLDAAEALEQQAGVLTPIDAQI